MSRPRVVVLRGHNVNVWDLRPLEQLAGEYDVSVLLTGSNLHNTDGLGAAGGAGADAARLVARRPRGGRCRLRAG